MRTHVKTFKFKLSPGNAAALVLVKTAQQSERQELLAVPMNLLLMGRMQVLPALLKATRNKKMLPNSSASSTAHCMDGSAMTNAVATSYATFLFVVATIFTLIHTIACCVTACYRTCTFYQHWLSHLWDIWTCG